jgi:hypothetical protein
MLFGGISFAAAESRNDDDKRKIREVRRRHSRFSVPRREQVTGGDIYPARFMLVRLPIL